MCGWFDETCGQLLKHLDDKGLRDNTLVVYVTDNGWIHDPSGPGYRSDSKQSQYDGGLRTPIMVRWPGKVRLDREIGQYGMTAQKNRAEDVRHQTALMLADYWWAWLSAASEAEVSARQVAIERDELRLMPDLEEKELALILQAKGLSADNARESAAAMMRDPQRALDTKVQEELGIQSPSVTPLADGLVTGTATAVGAVIPILPFLVMPLGTAIWVSLTVSMAAHFAVGAARSVFTGRGVIRSGMDMFVVGLGVAAVGYYVGEWIAKAL